MWRQVKRVHFLLKQEQMLSWDMKNTNWLIGVFGIFLGNLGVENPKVAGRKRCGVRCCTLMTNLIAHFMLMSVLIVAL